MVKISTMIKYLDLFGTRCTFYSDKMPKFYTVTGGIFTILSVLVCILISAIFSLDDIKRKFPDITTSFIPSQGYRKIKIGKEKIWIPWRIVNFNNNSIINYTNLLYPIIYYYSRTHNNETGQFHLTTKILDYKLCNETSLAKESNIYQINVPLNELYCINMDDLEMGGSWITDYINYISFDLNYCENGINYDENNIKCSSFNKIHNFIGKNNAIEIDVFYPIVQFQPTNKTYPAIVIYRQHFYHLSKYVYKVDRFFLQENVLTDDSGWFIKKEYNNSFWGLNTISDDTYFNGNENDLMNEGFTSRAYSFHIYLEPDIILYKRKYKKLYIIFSDFFPVAYIIFIVMKNIAKCFKKAESNKKMIELLFENLKEKPNSFEETLYKLRMKNNSNKLKNYKFITKKANEKSIENYSIKKQKLKYSIEPSQINNNIFKNNSFKNLNISKLNNNNNNNNSNNNSNNKSNNNINKSLSNKNIHSKFYQNNKKLLLNNNNTTKQNLMSNENSFFKDIHLREKINKFESCKQIKPKKKIIKQRLFPYKYYLCSVFIRNLDASQDSFFYTSRFAKVYSFLCQLFDITTYLCFQRELNALKKTFNEKSIHLIEKNKKININSDNFIRDINQCIGERKFYILAQGIKK
jgi:hypothetical protein